jgi:hypothetical protein
MKNLTSGARKRKTKKRYVFVAYDNIRNKYNTEQVMKELRTSKSSESVLVDMIKKVSDKND